jgi:hypothetical protein
MYLEMSISEFKAWCVNHKNELKKVQSLRIQTSKGTTSHDNLKSFGVKILELEKRKFTGVTITSVFDKELQYNGKAYGTAEVFYDLFLNDKLDRIEFNAGFAKL